MFGEGIALFVDRGFRELANDYARRHPDWCARARGFIGERQGTGVNLQDLRDALPEAQQDLQPKAAKLAEYLFDLEQQRRMLEWLVSRTNDEIEFPDPDSEGLYAKLLHDSVFIHAYALVDKSRGVVMKTAINMWGNRLYRTKREAKEDYDGRFKNVTINLEDIRHSLLHGQAGSLGPEASEFSKDGWWPYLFAAQAWPPGQPIYFYRFAGRVSQWMERLLPAASNTAYEIGSVLKDLADELQLSKGHVA